MNSPQGGLDAQFQTEIVKHTAKFANKGLFFNSLEKGELTGKFNIII